MEAKSPTGALVPPRCVYQPGANRGRPHLPDGPEPLPHLLGVDEGLRQLAGDAHQEPTRGYRGARFQGNGRLGRSYLCRILFSDALLPIDVVRERCRGCPSKLLERMVRARLG